MRLELIDKSVSKKQDVQAPTTEIAPLFGWPFFEAR
jgi:hypothetical protein